MDSLRMFENLVYQNYFYIFFSYKNQVLSVKKYTPLFFFLSSRTGKSLDKYYKMYRFSVCKQCNGRVGTFSNHSCNIR